MMQPSLAAYTQPLSRDLLCVPCSSRSQPRNHLGSKGRIGENPACPADSSLSCRNIGSKRRLTNHHCAQLQLSILRQPPPQLDRSTPSQAKQEPTGTSQIMGLKAPSNAIPATLQIELYLLWARDQAMTTETHSCNTSKGTLRHNGDSWKGPAISKLTPRKVYGLQGLTPLSGRTLPRTRSILGTQREEAYTMRHR
jgi:hypothetical protein